MVKGAVYVPSKQSAIEIMIAFAKKSKKKQPMIVDLGSGDGRVVEAFALAGFQAHGFEVNPLLVLKAWRRLRKANVTGRAHIFKASYWEADLQDYDVVVVYGITYIMKDLAAKLRHELRPGSLIISNYFELPGWKKIRTQEGIHLYQR